MTTKAEIAARIEEISGEEIDPKKHTKAELIGMLGGYAKAAEADKNDKNDKIPSRLSDEAIDRLIDEQEEYYRGWAGYPWDDKFKAKVRKEIAELPDLPAINRRLAAMGRQRVEEKVRRLKK